MNKTPHIQSVEAYIQQLEQEAKKNGKPKPRLNPNINYTSFVTNGVHSLEITAKEEHLTESPEIVEVQFMDKSNTILTPSTIQGVKGGNATNFLYGKKLKVKIITKEVKDGTKIGLKLKGETKSSNQNFLGINTLTWELKVKQNKCETDFFILPVLWYSEDFETYDYHPDHKTTIETNNLNMFFVEVKLNGRTSHLPKRENWLKPIAYRRNYEELIGLFKTDNSGIKDLFENYENKFINSNSDVLKLVKAFSEFIAKDDLKLDDIKDRIKTDAKQLWNLAVKQVQSGNLDDRPLYWARNKMQVLLKRHPLFYEDINSETSIVKNNTDLDKIIILFEEKSRNYTGIDFSKAGDKKKVLITGFDPFLLNSFTHEYKNSFNILQSNPSGCVALMLNNDDSLGAYIQTMIVPVRYTDFDGSIINNEGQGKGIIEKHISRWINEVDMIITISQSLPGDYNIDKFATSRRGGFNDNVDFTRKNESFALSTDDEWIETTLPREMTNAPYVEYNWKFNRIPNPEKIKPSLGQKLSQGSGGDYLSNEIFYRVAKLRKDKNPTLPTGHFHISKLQNERIKEDFSNSKTEETISIVSKGIMEGIKGL